MHFLTQKPNSVATVKNYKVGLVAGEAGSIGAATSPKIKRLDFGV